MDPKKDLQYLGHVDLTVKLGKAISQKIDQLMSTVLINAVLIECLS